MKSIYLFVCLCFIFQISFTNISAQTEVPTIFPASPEAASIGKYGDIPINLSTGKINYTIPFYTIEENGFQLPINLSYNYSGLLIDDIPGFTGMGWALNGGGLITRQVRGRPDEDLNGYIGTAEIGKNFVIPYINHTLSATEKSRLLQEANLGVFDTQPDKFVVNIGNVQANFYFNENKEVVILPYKPYKIEVINGDFSQGFKIIDENGIQYFFKEKEHSLRKRITSINDLIATPINGYTSSWKISQIILPTGKEIVFNYDGYSYYQRFSSDTYRKTISGTNCSGILDFDLKHIRTHYLLNTKILRKIIFSKGEIEFNTTTIGTNDVNEDYNKYLASLNRITIKDKNLNLINSFDLTYDDSGKTRKLLRKITINNDPENSYNLTYYGAPSDNIPFSKQDFWGYANSNSSGRLIDFDNLYASRVPAFSKSRIGALKSIQYPTKGITQIEYEANTYDPGPNGDDLDDFAQSSGECANLTESLSVSAAIHHGSPSYDVSKVETFTVTSNDFYVKINLNVVKNAVFGNVYAGLRKLGSGEVGCESAWLPACASCSNASEYLSGGFTQTMQERSFHSQKQHRLIPGTYELYVSVFGGPRPCDGSYPQFNGCESLSASASIQFSDGPTAIIRSRETGGIRVSKVTSCPDVNLTKCVIKKYVYEDDNGISRGYLFRRRNLFSYNSFLIGANNCTFKNYSSSSNTPLGTYFGSHIIYDRVKEYTIDNQGNKNGEKITNFKINTDAFIPEYPFIELNHYEWYNGKVLGEHFNDANGNPLKTNSFGYLLNVAQSGGNTSAFGMKVGKHTSNSGVSGWLAGGGNTLDSFYSVGLSTFSSRNEVDLLKSKTEVNYYSGTNETQTVNYFYNNPVHLQLTSTQTNTSDNKTITTKTYYPDDVTNTNSLGNDVLTTAEKAAIDKLKTQHRIAEPIQVETTVKNASGTQLSKSTERTNYKDWGLNTTGKGNLVLPEFIQTLKGNYTTSNKLQDRIQFKSYYANGNIKEVSKKDGTNIVYIWGYNEQYPIAKIENATYAQIASQVTNLQNLSNADNSISQENNLRNALESLRNLSTLSNALVTTYTYDPLIGVTSITDPTGNTIHYHYDAFNRLEYITDKDGKILSKNEYNYKSQN